MLSRPVRSPAALLVPIAAATLITAAIHIHLAMEGEATPTLRVLFGLAAVGYLATLAALVLPVDFFRKLRPLSAGALLVTTVATIVGYFVVMGFTFGESLALPDKIVEVVLVVLLVADLVVLVRRQRAPEPQAVPPRAEEPRYRAAS